MLKNKYQFNSLNFLILALLFLVFIPINTVDYCKDYRMQGFYITQTTFEQYGKISPYHYYRPEYHNFLNKNYYYSLDYWKREGWAAGYGNIIEQIDFKRDFHLGLRNIPFQDDYYPFGYNYGLAVVFGAYKAYDYKIKYSDNYFVVYGLEKSFVIFFRFFDRKILIYDCLKNKCSERPTKEIQFPQLSQSQTLNVHILYYASSHLIEIYNNNYASNVGGEFLGSYNEVYLTDVLERGKGYLGFAANDYYGNYYIDLHHTYYCINGGEKITPKEVYLKYNEEKIKPGNTLIVPPLQKLKLVVDYNTKPDADLMGSGYFTIDGKISSIEASRTGNTFTFEYSLGDTYKVIKLVYYTDYDEYEFTINVQSTKIDKLIYVYGGKPSDTNNFIIEGNNRILKYGTLDGDFDISEFKDDSYLYFHVKPKDDYNHYIDIQNVEEIRKELEDKSNSAITLQKVENSDHIYKVGVKVNKKGKYSINSYYLEKNIVFYVKNLEPSKTNSKCEIEGPTDKAFDRNVEIRFLCEFKDENNEEIDIEDAKRTHNLKIKTHLYRNDELLNDIEGDCNGNKCNFSYKTVYNGKYKFETEFGIDEMETIDSKKNIFYVSPEPTTLEGSYFYNYELDQWIKRDDIEGVIFNYYENAENRDNLLLIDLVDINAPKKNKYSEIEYSYENFNPDSIEGFIKEDHSGINEKLSFEKVKKDNKNYILVKLMNSKSKLRRSSLKYTIVLKLGITQNLVSEYKLEINGYFACGRNLQINNSVVNQTNQEPFKAGEYVKVAKLMLRTDTVHLYNYFLDDINKITFYEVNDKCQVNKDCEVEKVRSDIEGIYEVYFKSLKSGDFKIAAKIDGNNLKDKYDFFTVNILPKTEAHYIEVEEQEEKNYTAGEEVKFRFEIKDQYENPINYDLPPDNFGLEYYLVRNDEEKIYSDIHLEKGSDCDDCYYIIENAKKSGNYILTLKTKNGNSIVHFTYNKSPGDASHYYSTINALNSNKLNKNDRSTVKVDLYDSFYNYINSDPIAYEREIQKVEIYAENGDKKYYYIFNNEKLFTTEQIDLTGSYQIHGFVNGEEISQCYSCYFEVADYGYDFSSSQLKMIGEKTILMKKGNVYTLYEGLQRPAFEFDFLTEDGLPSNEIESDTEINAYVIDENNEKKLLEKIWIDINKLIWVLPDNYELKKNKKYTINVDNQNMNSDYYLKIVEYGEDKSTEEDYDLSNTFVSPDILYLKAGISDSFIVEFRDKDDLRYNKHLDLDNFNFKNSSDLQIKPKLGNKNGQIIVEVNSKTVCDYSKKCNIAIYEGNETIANVHIVVSPGDLHHFKIDESSIFDDGKNILIPGEAGSDVKINIIPYDKYDNLIKDDIFDTKVYPEESFSNLFKLKHLDGYKTSIKSKTNPVTYKIELSLSSEKSGTLVLSSIYLDKIYEMTLEPGSPSKYSVGYLEGEPGDTSAGTERKFIIEPKDKNGNKIILDDDKEIEELVKKYKVKIVDLDGNVIVDSVTPTYNKDKHVIEYKIDNEKAQTKVVEAFYNNDEIIINNNIINVVNGEPSLDNSRIIYNEKEYTLNDNLTISLATLPEIDLVLYDKYGNKVDISNNKDYYFKLVDGENELSKNIIYNDNLRLYIDDSKVDDYFKIKKNDNNCKLIIKIKEEKEINVHFSDEAPSKDEEKPISFVINADNLVLKAGEKGIIPLTFYTEKGKQMGYFFNLISEISVSTPDQNIETEVLVGNTYGKYNIIISSKKITNGEIQIFINAINKRKAFNIRIVPNKVNKCLLDETSQLKAVSGYSFSLVLKCVDKYDNPAILDERRFGAYIKDPNNEIVEYNLNLKDKNSYLLHLTPTIKGNYVIKSIYLPEEIVFNTVAGDISPENSYLEIKNNADAGEDIDVNIYVFDKYGNDVELKDEHKKLFDLYYRYKENSEFSKYKKVENTPQLDKNIINYKQKVTKGGINEFRGIEPNTSYIIRCENCEVKVNPSEFNLDNSDVYKFNSFSKTYTKLKKYNDALYNLDEELLIRIYPKDLYGNKVSAENLEPTVTIDGNELTKTDFNEEFLEFKETNGKFSELNGEKQLIINYDNKNVIYTVFVSGKTGFDEELDVSKTEILDKNLEFTAGNYGYFNLELRNANNVRYNKIFSGSIEIEPTDPQVTYRIFNQQSSTILVLVSSENSNTFPNLGESKVSVLINTQKVFDLELLVNPGAIYSATINSGNPNLVASADKELMFSLIGYDKFNNKVLINQNEVKLVVKNKKEEVSSYKSTFMDLATGEQKYIYELTLVGIYEITSGIKNLFNETIYIIEVNPGEICPENTLAEIENTPISAGNTAVVVVKAKDKNNNEVFLKSEDTEKFNAYILYNEYDLITPTKELISDYSSSFKYKKQLDKIGLYQFYVNFNGKKINIDKKVEVNPSVCNVNNTLIYSKDKNGEYALLDINEMVYSFFDYPLNLLLVFRDDYNNTLLNIGEIEVNEAYLYGNNMENLNWTYKDGKLFLDLDNSENKNILEHLVTRKGEKAYDFTFKVKYNGNTKQFDLKVNHFSKKGEDEEYGNGDYDLDFCGINKDEAEFRAGSKYEIILTLRTKENLIYNGEFDMKNIDCSEIKPFDGDDSFTCNVSFKAAGVYSLQYYTTKQRKREDGVHNIIKLYHKNHSNPRTFTVLLINDNGVPDKEKTYIISSLPQNISDGDHPYIKYILRDSFGNDFNPKRIIDYLFFKNNNEEIQSISRYDEQTNEITSTLTVSYPPKDINIQLYYRDEETGNSIELFKEVQKSQFIIDIDYDFTKVISTNANSMKAGEYLDIKVYVYDKKSICYNELDVSSNLYVTVQGPLETSIEKRKYYFKKYEDEDEICKNYYKIEIDEEHNYVSTGTYSIIVYAENENKQLASFTQTVNSDDIDTNNFEVYYVNLNEKSYTDQNIPAGENIAFMVQAYDKYKNKIDHISLSPDLFTIEIESNNDNYTLSKEISGAGALRCVFNSEKDGSFKFNYFYRNSPIKVDTTKGPNVIIYVPGLCSEINPQVIYPPENEVDISVPYNYIVKCLDKYNNTVKEGGAKFTSDITLNIPDSDSIINLDAKIYDNKDGSYNIVFTPPLLGVYSIVTRLDGKKYHELSFNITGKTCEEGYYTCPNIVGKCVEDLRDCIPSEIKCLDPEESKEKPFRCKGTDECVDSMTKCVPEDAGGSCKYMNALYPPGKSYLCSYYLPLDCKRKYPNYKILCNDGICRKNKNLQPNQRVCPIGKVLCADLTCKDNVNECYNDWPECGNTQIRCPDQSCVDDQKNCPTTITCANPNDFVCPDGTCVENEIYCSKLKVCPEEAPYLCSDNSCSVTPESCPHNVACGHGKSLCSDLICRESC